MTRVLKLYNTFTKKLNPVVISGKLISSIKSGHDAPVSGSFYICGPTVYSDCHLGHALTYIRADLLSRFLKSFFNVRLFTVMNITDIDDKILEKTREILKAKNKSKVVEISSDPSLHPFTLISEKYYSSFVKDMQSIRVKPADLYLKISKHIDLITAFIGRLEREGHTYITSSGDINFKVNSVQNYVGRTDPRKEVHHLSKLDPRDFALWKSAKPNEPVWNYKSTLTGKSFPGRPGWHVQCSAMSSALFGNSLDIHFGGKDLIFPHHYNEEACCCAYHNLDTSQSIHVWANHWLHSGHLILKENKMSKSLGNVIAINNFIDRSSVNALRLLCVYTHYRTDLDFDEDLLEKIKNIDHKISAFVNFLSGVLRNAQEKLPHLDADSDNVPLNAELELAVLETYQNILDGVCEDFHLDKGLEAILALSRLFYSKEASSIRPKSVISALVLLEDWCGTCGLEYGPLTSSLSSPSHQNELVELLTEYRRTVRGWSIKELKSISSDETQRKASLCNLLESCDNLRSKMDEYGFVIRDKKA